MLCFLSNIGLWQLLVFLFFFLFLLLLAAVIYVIIHTMSRKNLPPHNPSYASPRIDVPVLGYVKFRHRRCPLISCLCINSRDDYYYIIVIDGVCSSVPESHLDLDGISVGTAFYLDGGYSYECKVRYFLRSSRLARIEITDSRYRSPIRVLNVPVNRLSYNSQLPLTY